MSITLQKYLAEVRAALICASCLHNFPCQVLERHNKPEVEIQTSPELILDPVTVERGNGECCLIEQTINSTRVSFKFLKPADEMEDYLLHTYLRFMMHR